MGFCTQCGYRFTAPANFCPRCGAPNVTPPSVPESTQPGQATGVEASEVEERTVVRSDIIPSLPPTPPPGQPDAAPPAPPAPYAAPGFQPPYPPSQPQTYAAAPPPTQPLPGTPPVGYPPFPTGAAAPPAASAPFAWTSATIRAAVGIGALTLSWALDWSSHHQGVYRLAILAVLVAIVGGCFALIPALRTAVPNATTIGLLTLAPLGALAVYTLLRSLIPSSGGGMEARDAPGAGMALAAVGAVLITQALLTGAPAALGVLWKHVCIGLLCAASLWGLVGAVDVFRGTLTGLDSLVLFGFVLLVTVIVILLTPLYFALQIARDRSPDWAAGMILVLALVAGYVIVAVSEGTGPGDVGGALTLFYLGMAAGSADPVAARMRPALVGADRWIQAVAGVLGLCAVGLGLSTLVTLGALSESKGSLILGIVVSLAGTIGAIVCRQLLVGHAPMARVATIGWAGALTLIATIVQIASDNAHLIAGIYTREYVLTMLPSILLPLSIVLALTVPPSVRALGPLLPGQRGPGQRG
ncbi:MAG: hypothetical protein V9G19_20075 [Tetrasphaera sp.]